MHILVLPSFYPSLLNKSLGYFFKEQVRLLAKENNKVGVIYVEQITLKKLNIKSIKQQYFQRTIETVDGSREYRICGWNLPSYFGKKIWIWLSLMLIRKYIRNEGKPDIIHVHNTFYAGLLGLKAKKKFNIPFVVTEHDSKVHIKQLNNSMINAGKNIHLESSRTIAVSESLSKSLTEILHVENPLVIPNVVDVNFFRPLNLVKIKQEKTVFIAIGHLYKNKGHLLLIKAFSDLYKDNPNILLKICGEGDEKENLHKLIIELKMEASILLLGHLSREEIRKQINESDWLVHSSYHETFGVVLIEAMACGKPFITSKCGGTEDIYEEEIGYLYSPGDTLELKNAMSTFIKNKNKFDAEFIRLKAISKYSDEVVYSMLHSVFSTAINSAIR